MFDYLRSRGKYAFASMPPGPIDSLIFSMLVHCPLERLPAASLPAPLGWLTAQIYPGPMPPEGDMARQRWRLWQAAASALRFSQVELRYFESRFDAAYERQFAGAIFQLNPVTAVVAFRGTDSTVVGWKEDFNMAFESPVPAQTDALAFLIRACYMYPHLYLCGHSKGGNLAVYSAAHIPADLRPRIRQVYSFDGPGVDDDTFASPEYAAISDRIRSYVPEASVVGMLLNYHEDYTVIDSDGISISQHNPFLWHIEDGQFITKEKLSAAGLFADQTFHDFLAGCSKEERRIVVDTLFDIIEATKARTLKEIAVGALMHFPAVLSAIKRVPEKNRAIMLKVAKTLITAGGNNLNLLFSADNTYTSGPDSNLPV